MINMSNKKLLKIKPVNKKLVIIIVVLILIESTAFRYYFGTINDYISDLNIVYTPSKPAYRFYHWHWTDSFEYYVFRLSNNEEKIIIQEAEQGKWSEMTSYHIAKLDFMDYEEVFGYSYRYHVCYICIYDNQNRMIITDSENPIYHGTSQCIIFLYDTETNKYYCMFQTM